MVSRPDVLVLGGGGLLGEAWMMGVLSGIEDATLFDLRDCEYFVGTSAGAIVAAHLAAGRSPRRPPSVGTEVERATLPASTGVTAAALAAARRAGDLALATGAMFAPFALGLAAPGGAVARALLLRRLPTPRATLNGLEQRIASLGARFDGRLRVAAVQRRSGRRVMFGSPGSPHASVAEAVAASCTVPWLFAPVTIDGEEFVDGGVWSPTNLDAAPAGRDTHVLCLNPTAGIGGSHTLVGLARRAARSAVSVEALVLRRRGAAVQLVAPNIESGGTMGGDFMDPEPRARALAAGYRQGLELATAATEP